LTLANELRIIRLEMQVDSIDACYYRIHYGDDPDTVFRQQKIYWDAMNEAYGKAAERIFDEKTTVSQAYKEVRKFQREVQRLRKVANIWGTNE
jgi:hypothetical protein